MEEAPYGVDFGYSEVAGSTEYTCRVWIWVWVWRGVEVLHNSVDTSVSGRFILTPSRGKERFLRLKPSSVTIAEVPPCGSHILLNGMTSSASLSHPLEV
jgi:hypothetical protein